jgi:hypothetical protein
MHKRLILVLGMFLGSYVPMPAQTLAPEGFPTQENIATVATTGRTVPAVSFARSFALSERPTKSVMDFGYLYAGTYQRQESFSPVHRVKTLFLTQSSLPLVQFWGGRLRLDGFTSRLHMQNVQFGPSATGGLQDFRAARQSYVGGPRSIGLYGVSLSFHFGRDARLERPPQIWRCVARIIRNPRSIDYRLIKAQDRRMTFTDRLPDWEEMPSRQDNQNALERN